MVTTPTCIIHVISCLFSVAAQLVTTIGILSGEQERIDEQLVTLKTLLEQVLKGGQTM